MVRNNWQVRNEIQIFSLGKKNTINLNLKNKKKKKTGFWFIIKT